MLQSWTNLLVWPLHLSHASEAYLETAGSRCISHIKVKRRCQNADATVFGKSALETCVRGKVLTRQPEISQLRRGSKSAYRFFLSAEATEECSPSGLNSAARNDVSCYATILQHALFIAQPVPGTVRSFADLSKNYYG
ncbi:hypothetical protein ALC56_05182 [Trachymyrmex septentrionalis]|uniref:Secreted protein n=1 Tax=Trachymyrmex septentrionalis TaxID=34720 RepID=A0A195FIZ6_9HYME|nr:hypothetical protein ALC56_05182 [Trachymyrmex septentrionalis]